MVIHFIKPVWQQYFEGKSWWYLNLQGDTQGHGGKSENLESFAGEISSAILPFP